MTFLRPRGPRSWRGPVLVAAGYAAGIAAMAWAIWLARGSDLGQQPAALAWRFVAAAAAVDLATYACQAWRWRLLVARAGRLSWFAAARIIFIGLFVSEVLPMRPGEGVRAWLAARRLGVRVAAIVPSIVVERFFDGVLLVASVAAMAMVAPLPPALALAARVLGAIVIALGAALAYSLMHGRRSGPSRDADRARSALRSIVAEIASGIHAIGVARTTAAAFALSCVLLAGQITAFWLAMRACGIDQSILVAAIVLTIVHLGTAVPTTPGNAGTFQVFVILGLTMFGVDRAAAAAFSLVGFVILTAPLWLIGGIASLHTGVGILSLRRLEETEGTETTVGYTEKRRQRRRNGNNKGLAPASCTVAARGWFETLMGQLCHPWRCCRSGCSCHGFATVNRSETRRSPGTEVAESTGRGVR